MVIIKESPAIVEEVFYELKDEPYGINLLKAKEVWDASKKGEGIVIAVIDTGCCTNHPDLKDNIIGGYNFTNDDYGDTYVFEDYRGHGTHVAGIIASKSNGIAPKSKLLVLKTFDIHGTGNCENVIRAIKYAVDWVGPSGEKVSIINMSIVGAVHSEYLYKVIREAREKGVLFVIATGNEGNVSSNTVVDYYPGLYQEVIQVGAINQSRKALLYSNTIINLDFLAPGNGIVSTFLGGNYAKMTGTSMAAPFVSGAFALVLNMVSSQTDNAVVSSYLAYSYLKIYAKKLGFSYLEEGSGLIQLI
ncbi:MULTISPECIES: S8 family peptidase [Bacillus]|uniref:S8 family peptidase n=1 Tax=Bacillus TaxID=1386 RepID=UPI0015723165|nr:MULTISPECIES: S8 family peptidase [Bacillus]MBC6975081.1 S8 family peptidase [Bacillus sp. Xin]MBY0600120.1 S8 family peptidase [Bacillus bingmayongensis]NSW38410.1 S8 family peptidase [Bacillus sp. Xin1]